jgi:adenine-specific DNA methylase
VARNLGVDLPIGEAAIREFLAEKAPPVLDPFCGDGSIPLEAQRLGLRAYASDLNPVAVLITKALIEIPPKFANRPPVHPLKEVEMRVALRNILVPFDIIVVTPDEVRRRRNIPGTIIRPALLEGKVLYVRTG